MTAVTEAGVWGFINILSHQQDPKPVGFPFHTNKTFPALPLEPLVRQGTNDSAPSSLTKNKRFYNNCMTSVTPAHH